MQFIDPHLKEFLSKSSAVNINSEKTNVNMDIEWESNYTKKQTKKSSNTKNNMVWYQCQWLTLLNGRK